MQSFEELGLRAELVEALLVEGIETPSELQSLAIPLLRKGNPAVLRSGPGAGTLVTYGAPLLDRLAGGAGQPVAIVLSPTRETAQAMAESLGRLGLATGHRVAALGGPWALPGHADVLVTTSQDLEIAIRRAEVKVDLVQALVLDGASAILEEPGRDRVGLLLGALQHDEVQVVVVSDPVTGAVREWVDEHLRRSVFLPPEAAVEEGGAAPVQRGVLRLRLTTSTGPDREVVAAVSDLFDEDTHHALVFFRTEDRAADAGDLLTLHGFAAGSPGDPSTPIWLGLNPLEDRKAIDASQVDPGRIVTVSLDAPPDVDTLDRRHGKSQRPGVCVATPREVPHLRRLAREAGYRLEVLSTDRDDSGDQIQAFRDEVERALEEEDLAAYVSLLEPLLERWTGVELAAALASIARQRLRERAVHAEGPGKDRPIRESVGRSRPPAWARLFLSVGSKDGVGPGDLLGAITGEAGLKGDQVGRIDVRDTFSRVEVEDTQAEKVIRALNGISIRGRSVRADFDRGTRRE